MGLPVLFFCGVEPPRKPSVQPALGGGLFAAFVGNLGDQEDVRAAWREYLEFVPDPLLQCGPCHRCIDADPTPFRIDLVGSDNPVGVDCSINRFHREPGPEENRLLVAWQIDCRTQGWNALAEIADPAVNFAKLLLAIDVLGV